MPPHMPIYSSVYLAAVPRAVSTEGALGDRLIEIEIMFFKDHAPEISIREDSLEVIVLRNYEDDATLIRVDFLERRADSLIGRDDVLIKTLRAPDLKRDSKSVLAFRDKSAW